MRLIPNVARIGPRRQEREADERRARGTASAHRALAGRAGRRRRASRARRRRGAIERGPAGAAAYWLARSAFELRARPSSIASFAVLLGALNTFASSSVLEQSW